MKRHYLWTLIAALAVSGIILGACGSAEGGAAGNGGGGGTPGSSPSNPASRIETGVLDWTSLLASITAEGMYVALDLSGVTGVTEFDPQPGVSDAGESRIVSLVLPGTATGVKVGMSSYPYEASFKYFTNLGSVGGAGVTDIGDRAFRDCTALTTASLPKAVTIGSQIFFNCTALTAVSLPEATGIGSSIFMGCPNLSTLNLSKVQSVGGDAFVDCSSLVSLSLPAVTSIGNTAFYGCRVLTTLNLPASPPNRGNRIFTYTTGGSSPGIVIHVPSGKADAYTGGADSFYWPEAAAGANASVYGDGHNAISIVDDL